MDKQYDYLIVGAGLFGCVFAQQAIQNGKTCLVIEKRAHIGGNIYCQEIEGIPVHRYGAHIFHTSDEEVWQYVNRFVSFNHYVNSPVAFYDDKVYNLPFNMNTFAQLWGIQTPQQAKQKIAQQTALYANIVPQNLEQQALQLVGKDIYETLIKEYTEKQWGRSCNELPSFIIKRLPLRFTYDNNYFNDTYQGIPIEGYNHLAQSLLKGADVYINTEFAQFHKQNPTIAKKIIYTGMIDEYFSYCYGHLAYRTVTFQDEILPVDNYQGNAVVNYTQKKVPYTRIIEHKHFVFGKQKNTVISKEYPCEWQEGMEPYYPVNDEKNSLLFTKYQLLAQQNPQVIFAGRLGAYQYFDMDKVIRSALNLAQKEFD